MFTSTLSGISFDDIWRRLGPKERQVCATRSWSAGGFECFIGWNPVNCYSAKKDVPLHGLKHFVEDEQGHGRRIFGYLSYDLGYSLLTIAPRAKNDINLPDIYFLSFDSWIRWTGKTLEIVCAKKEDVSAYSAYVRNILERAPAEVSSLAGEGKELTAQMTHTAYANGYRKIKKYIVEGDIYQMNYTHRLEAVSHKHSRTLFCEFFEKNRVDHAAYVEGEGFEIVSMSPERFIKISKDKTIETFPMKGTRPRGDTLDRDEEQKQSLLHSTKEAAELNMITDLLRNDIGKVAEIGSVQVLGSRIVRPYPHVWHTHAHIEGRLRDDISSLEALLSMFPGGSITGCPKKRAVEIIDEVEPIMRSIYTGSIGYIDPDDTLDFNIAIRTIVRKKEKVYLSVGGGIVFDSQEKDEYQETFDKAKSFFGTV